MKTANSKSRISVFFLLISIVTFSLCFRAFACSKKVNVNEKDSTILKASDSAKTDKNLKYNFIRKI